MVVASCKGETHQGVTNEEHDHADFHKLGLMCREVSYSTSLASNNQGTNEECCVTANHKKNLRNKAYKIGNCQYSKNNHRHNQNLWEMSVGIAGAGVSVSKGRLEEHKAGDTQNGRGNGEILNKHAKQPEADIGEGRKSKGDLQPLAIAGAAGVAAGIKGQHRQQEGTQELGIVLVDVGILQAAFYSTAVREVNPVLDKISSKDDRNGNQQTFGYFVFHQHRAQFSKTPLVYKANLHKRFFTLF